MKKLFLKIGLLFVLTVLPLAAINYIIDPLQCFRSAAWYQPLYDPNERVQSACLARSHKYDTIIMGSSHVENFDPIYIDQAFGGAHTVKLAMAASTLYEQKQMFALALNTGQVKNVVWGLDTNILNDDPQRVRDDIVRFPWHIYASNVYNNILFLLDPYIIKHYVKMAARRFLGMYQEYTDLRYLNNWERLFTFSKERTLEAYDAVKGGRMAAIANSIERTGTTDIRNVTTSNIDQNVIAIVQAHPETRFYIHFPPYSILRWVQLYEDKRDEFEIEFKLKAYLIKQLLRFDNAVVHDFQSLSEIIYDLDNYKDLSHFSSAVNRYIIDSLGSGQHALKRENSTATLEDLRTQLGRFDFSLIK